MIRAVPTIDPKVHLKGATPEALARCPVPSHCAFTRDRWRVCCSSEVAVEEVASDEFGNGVLSLQSVSDSWMLSLPTNSLTNRCRYLGENL